MTFLGLFSKSLPLALLACSVPVARASAQEIDTATALSALRDARSICEADRGDLWNRSLCGPIALVDRQTRLVIANDTVPGKHFLRLGDAYVSTLPASQYVANTSFPWGGRTWTMVALPLPKDRYSRADLVMHESFHREQQALGLRQTDALNNHLDMRPGRTWLRLEYRALARALDALPNSALARHHAESALIFRAQRRSIYPGSDTLEATLEIQEGLPEYTGQRLAMRLTGDGPARVAQHVREYEANTPTFVRAFAYGTGPALGVLLDHFSPGWRDAIRTRRDVGALLAQSIDFRIPAPRLLGSVARARAQEYGWDEVDHAEAARESARAPLMREYRARLQDGPTITLTQSRDSLSWSFDPTELIGFDLSSAIYPSGTFSAGWGKLTVERGGVLVANDLSRLRVGAPSTQPAPAATSISGDGWTLVLNPGWALVP
ncbi:MAG TPA: hypothetical protein VGO75_02990, partial [Gemmatimonadaceae bacterium]|nr:hypothetical protein [Gemmatimonadaceae bacterium]